MKQELVRWATNYGAIPVSDLSTRRAILAMPLVSLLPSPAQADAPPGWPTKADRARMAEDCRLVAIAESGGPPAPPEVTGRLALDVVRFLRRLPPR